MPTIWLYQKKRLTFYRSRHTNVAKTEMLTRVDEVGELLEIESRNALHQLQSDKLLQIYVRISHLNELI